MVERSVNKLVGERAGVVEIGSIRLSVENGLVVVIESYREPNVHVENLRLTIPFVSLLEYRDSMNIRAVAESVTLELPTELTAEGLMQAEQFNTIGETITDLCREVLSAALRVQFQTVECEIADLTLTSDSFNYSSKLYVSCDASNGGDWITDIRSESEHFGLQAQVCIDKAAELLAVDFSMGARKWETLSGYDLDLSIAPFESGAFADASGYFRWAASDADTFNFAILGTIAPWQYAGDASKMVTRSASFGIATNGVSVFRAYLNTPFEALILGSEHHDSGEFTVEIDNHQLKANLQTGSNRLGFSSLGFQSFLEGFGELTATCEFEGVDSNQLSRLIGDTAPSDLAFVIDAESSATIEIENYAMTRCSGSIAWELEGVQLEILPGETKLDYEPTSGAQIKSEFDRNAVGGESLSDEIEITMDALARSLVERLKQLRIQK
ncbi:MAG: hypothetical protein ACSHYA_17435 [Opitutaceae bacterium]